MGNTNFDSVELNDLVEYCTASITITSAQLLALNATPITLVQAPGSNKMLIFNRMTVHKPAGTAYAGIAAGEDLAVKYTNSSGAQVNTSLEATGFLDQTTKQTRLSRAIVTEYTPIVNAALVLQMLTGEITTGNSPLYIKIEYAVVRNVEQA